MIVGYARVSTDDQRLSLQIIALESAGCTRIYSDHGVSGGKTSRPGLDRALRSLKPGDTLIVWRLDRLGRSLIHMVRLLNHLANRQIGFRSLNESIDTDSSGGRLIFHIMAALAEFERALISERTRAGMDAARIGGKQIGRPASLTPSQCQTAFHLRVLHGWTTQRIAAYYGVHPRTLLRHLTALSLLQDLPGMVPSWDACPECGALKWG